MKHLGTILCPTDFSECAAVALEHAVALAARYGARLHVLHVRALMQDDPYNPDHHFPDREQYDEILERIDREQMDAVDVRDEIEVVKESVRAVSVAPAILNRASDLSADTIVMGTHGRTGLPHILLGSVAEQVVRLSPVPVLTVSKSAGGPVTRKDGGSILVPVDLSDASRKSLQAAVGMAKQCACRLILLHVIEDVPHPAYYLFGKKSIIEVFPDLVDRVRKALNDLDTEAIPEELESEIIVAEGRAHVKISEIAREHDVGLIVMSSEGLHGIERLLVGSVTERVVRTAPCPVLAVK